MSNLITSSDQLIRVSDNQYPVYLSQVRRENQLISLPVNPTVAQIEALGYKKVILTDKPTGDVVTELAPELVGDEYEQRWSVRPFNEQELAQQLEQQKNVLKRDYITYKEKLLNNGVEYDFGGEYGVLHIQVRDGDRTNLVALRLDAEAQIRNSTSNEKYFRVYENINVPLTPEEIVVMTDAALTGVYQILLTVWPIADQIESATNISELPVIPSI